MDPLFTTGGIPLLKLFCTQILLAERSRAEDLSKDLFQKKTVLIFIVLTQMRQESQVKHQNPNQISPLGSLLTKIHLKLPTACLPQRQMQRKLQMLLVKKTGFTADHQLCSVVFDIMWAARDNQDVLCPLVRRNALLANEFHWQCWCL